MKHLRLKASLHLNQEHFISEVTLDDIKLVIERAIASALPEELSVDMIEVTSLKEASSRNEGAEKQD